MSARWPTYGATRPPKVMPRPSVIPDAKPAFLARYFCPSTVIGPYCENTPKAIGIIAPKKPQILGTNINTKTDGKKIRLPKRTVLRKPN